MSGLAPPLRVLEIWIDGDCALCRRSERWCRARDPERRLRFRDLHEASADELPRSPEEMMGTVHLRLPDGTVATGFDAWRRILRELPGWRWLARFSALPGITQLGAAVYSVVARNRHRHPADRG